MFLLRLSDGRFDIVSGEGTSHRQKTPPIIRLGHLLERPVSLGQKSLHVASEKTPLGNLPQQSEWSREVELILHSSPRRLWKEKVAMSHRGKGTGDHFIRERMRVVHLGNAHGQSLSDTEMRRLPGDGFTQLDQTRSAACDSTLARAVRARHVGVDAASQIEDPFDGSMDESREVDLRHARKVYR